MLSEKYVPILILSAVVLVAVFGFLVSSDVTGFAVKKISCAGGTLYNRGIICRCPGGLELVQGRCSCPQGYKEVALGKCAKLPTQGCRSNQILDSKTGKCVCRNAPSEIVNRQGVCTCAPGFRNDPAQGMCVPSSSPAKQPSKGFIWDEGTGTRLQLNQPLGAVRATITGHDTKLLKDYTLQTVVGGQVDTSRVHQYLSFANSKLMPIFDEDERDVEGFFLFANDGDELFTYEQEFEDGLLLSGNQDREMVVQANILGEEYTTLRTYHSSPSLTLEFIKPGKSIRITDENTRDTLFSSPSSNEKVNLEVDGKKIEDASVQISTNSISPEKEELGRFSIRLNADAVLGDVYIPVGGTLSKQLQEPEGMLSNKWNIKYTGKRTDGSHEVRFVET